jgi:hypothetical protein
MGTLGFGYGINSRYNFSTTKNLFTNLHLAVVPLAGNSSAFGRVDSSTERRDYNYGGGAEGKFEMTLNLGRHFTTLFTANYYYIRNYIGRREGTLLGILKPRVTYRLFDDFHLGFEHTIYYNSDWVQLLPPLHVARTEQKIFVMLFLEDKKRRGRYH